MSVRSQVKAGKEVTMDSISFALADQLVVRTPSEKWCKIVVTISPALMARLVKPKAK